MPEGYGVRKIVGCDLSSMMLKEAKRQHPDVSFWCGAVVDLTDTRGPFDAVFLNAMFGNVWDQSETLRNVDTLLSATGRVCISHPLGFRLPHGGYEDHLIAASRLTHSLQ